MKKIIGIVCGVAAVVILFAPVGKLPPLPPSPVEDSVHEAFVTYERLWRKLAVETASKLDSKELTTEKQTWDFLASGQEPIRKIAFDSIAKKEQEQLADGWSAGLHSKILRSYSGE